jgi:hypothetical protein
MIRQCFLAETGIQFYRESFISIGLDPATLFPKVLPRLPQLKPSASCVVDARAATCSDIHHDHNSYSDQVPVQASPVAGCTFISEDHEELLDALSPINDQLGPWLSPWRILEIVPFLHSEQNRNDPKLSWDFDRWYVFFSPIPSLCRSRGRDFFLLRPNLARGRQIPTPARKRKEKVLVHRSVKTRMDAECFEKYKPKARFEGSEIEWVEWVE